MSVLPITWKVYVDWNNDVDFADANEDVSANVLSVSASRGRTSVTDDFAAGSCSIQLDNQSGLYSLFNTGGALYGSLLPGRHLKVEAVHNAITYPVFRGFLAAIEQGRTPTDAPIVNLIAEDGFAKLARSTKIQVLREDQTIQALLANILLGTGWPIGLTDWDVGIETLPLFWVHRLSQLEAYKLAAKQELGGQLYMSRDGKITFADRFARSSEALHATLTGPQTLAQSIQHGDFFDEIQFIYSGLSVDATVSVLWDMGVSSLALEETDTIIEGEYQIAGKSPVTPVAYTDYTANSSSDGSGVDMTPYVTVVLTNSYGGGFKLTFTKSVAATVHLTLCQLRGYAVRRSAHDRLVTVDVSSPVTTDQVLRDNFDFNDDAYAVEQYAQVKAGIYSKIQPRLIVKVPARSDAEIVSLLGGELGKRIRVQNTTGLYPTELDDFFYIENIQIGSVSGRYVQATWGLFHEDLALGNYFRISAAAGGGQDYSTIVAAGATNGARLAF